jgi:hypothetical protein
MRELCGNARNEFFVIGDDGELIPSAEIVIMTSQPEFVFAPGGGLTRTRGMSEFRFCAQPKGLRELAAFLTEAADDLDKHLAKHSEAKGAES